MLRCAGDIIGRFERKGFKLRGLKLYQTPKEVAEEHYKDLQGKPFYPALVEYITSGPVVGMVRGARHGTADPPPTLAQCSAGNCHCAACKGRSTTGDAGQCGCAVLSWCTSCMQVWEGKGVVASARKIIGATNPLVSEPGTIRGDFAIEVGRNVVHGSDSPENGEREAGGFGLAGRSRVSKYEGIAPRGHGSAGTGRFG